MKKEYRSKRAVSYLCAWGWRTLRLLVEGRPRMNITIFLCSFKNFSCSSSRFLAGLAGVSLNSLLVFMLLLLYCAPLSHTWSVPTLYGSNTTVDVKHRACYFEDNPRQFTLVSIFGIVKNGTFICFDEWVQYQQSASIAQLVEPLSYTQLVPGSSPGGCTLGIWYEWNQNTS